MNQPQIIPKIIHRVWFGTKPVPENTIRFIDIQKSLCRDYENVLWREDDVKSLYPFMCSGSVKMFEDTRINPVIKSDIMRYELLSLFGGIYIDTDIEVLRNFDELLAASFFCADEGMGNVGTALLGSVPFHPLNRAMLDAIYKNYCDHGVPTSPNQQMNFCGPWLFTKTVKAFGSVEILQRQILYPFHSPKLPATVHYFNGGGAAGWTKCIGKGVHDTENHSPGVAGQRPNTGTPRVFYGRNVKVQPRPQL
jgi:hypothetical protein